MHCLWSGLSTLPSHNIIQPIYISNLIIKLSLNYFVKNDKSFLHYNCIFSYKNKKIKIHQNIYGSFNINWVIKRDKIFFDLNLFFFYNFSVSNFYFVIWIINTNIIIALRIPNLLKLSTFIHLFLSKF